MRRDLLVAAVLCQPLLVNAAELHDATGRLVALRITERRVETPPSKSIATGHVACRFEVAPEINAPVVNEVAHHEM
jgi:hypothetical protein